MFLIHQPDDAGEPSVYPQFNTIEKNLMIANYNSQEAVEYVAVLSRACTVTQPDPYPHRSYVNASLSALCLSNDDGSGFFHTYNNVLVYGHYGQKADMAGHDNWHVGNLYAYVSSHRAHMGWSQPVPVSSCVCSSALFSLGLLPEQIHISLLLRSGWR
eukprot:COSAG02_NODE_6361_length_3624_cov_1.946099_3_plen_158_part_00